jgi:hypothetical protein
MRASTKKYSEPNLYGKVSAESNKKVNPLATSIFLKDFVGFMLLVSAMLPVHGIAQDTSQSKAPSNDLSTNESLSENIKAENSISLPEPAASQTQVETTQKQNIVTPTLGKPSQYSLNATQQQQLIEAELRRISAPGKPEWLETKDGRFLAIWHQDVSGEPKGAALILPDENVNPASDSRLKNLQQYLSQNGWASLTLSLPVQRESPPPENSHLTRLYPTANKSPGGEAPASGDIEQTNKPTDSMAGNPADSADQNPSSILDEKSIVHEDTAEDLSSGKLVVSGDVDPNSKPGQDNIIPEPIAPVEPEVQNRIFVGLDFLQNRQQFNNIMIGDGLGAARALHYMELVGKPTDPALSVRAMVLINSRHNISELPDFSFLQAFSELKIPILDLLEDRHSQIDKRMFSQRKNTANSARLPLYVSREIKAGTSNQAGEQRLTRLIRGFLQRYVKGEEAR